MVGYAKSMLLSGVLVKLRDVVEKNRIKKNLI